MATITIDTADAFSNLRDSFDGWGLRSGLTRNLTDEECLAVNLANGRSADRDPILTNSLASRHLPSATVYAESFGWWWSRQRGLPWPSQIIERSYEAEGPNAPPTPGPIALMPAGSHRHLACEYEVDGVVYRHDGTTWAVI